MVSVLEPRRYWLRKRVVSRRSSSISKTKAFIAIKRMSRIPPVIVAITDFRIIFFRCNSWLFFPGKLSVLLEFFIFLPSLSLPVYYRFVCDVLLFLLYHITKDNSRRKSVLEGKK